MAQFDLEQALSPDFTAGLERLPIGELRAKRDACAELETELSYVRRLAQARVDLVLAESHRRGGMGDEAAETSAEELVQRLPQILGEHERQEGPGRLPTFLAPAEGEQARLAARVERVLPSEQLGSLDGIPPARLDALLEQLSELERQVSSERRALHDIQDRLQEELVRRYRSGEANVDTLLRQ